ncbi:DUF1800 domain-containing protein [Lacihabitans sp. LS3-19]|uniref:DUF1800 domain-containing protein n=1 Tax=Lacihabitans sp. LS3-19 TaxID=2487335 RepID=UPI0020CEBA57|nr:DUF1800 family protein [Lacihabitans sp. LS3-19]MCP9767776.1 DUF1800 domain-containing protein [Lacihabitans sp. LS3-19]
MKSILFFTFFVISLQSSFSQNTRTFGKGNIKGVSVNASSNTTNGIKTLLSTGYMPNPKASSRFLSQATLGPKLSEIQALQNLGIEPWLNQQFAMNPSFNLQAYVQGLHQNMVDSLNLQNPAGNYTLDNVFIDDWAFDVAWFQANMHANDRLRWKVSLALSEIFVTSRISAFDGNPYALASYYDMLNKNAFGNYRSLIDSITYHPAMSVYLTYINNHATDTTGGKHVFPDENYAREIMQLFSIGLYELNTNGTEKKDGSDKSIPTYDNDDIANLAKVFTGLSWSNSRYLGENAIDKWSYTKRLKFFPVDSSEKYTKLWKKPIDWRIVNGHEPGIKTFLNQTVISRPVQQGEQDIQDALNIIFNHPNVGPFISRRLIQHLVSSNPSPEFIERVAKIFNNNGSNVRGDLKAVVRAILLDPEARDCCGEKENTAYGHLREPFLRYMNLVNGLELSNQSGIYRNVMVDLYNRLEQKPLYSPSVFNFYQPGYVPDGPIQEAGKVGPEFQMLNSLSFSNYMNGLHKWLISNDPVEFWGMFSNETYKPDQDPKFDISADFVLSKNNRIREFLDKYNLILAQGRINQENMAIIENVLLSMPLTIDVNGVPDPTLADRRLRMGIFLIMISPDYLINR